MLPPLRARARCRPYWRFGSSAQMPRQPLGLSAISRAASQTMGQRKRAGLARAIATEPKYLLYDEPTTGLDPVTTTVIDRLIIRTREELKVTSVVITHDMDSAYKVPDRIGMLYDGVIRFMGTPDEIQACTDPVVRGFIEGKPELLEGAG